MKKYLLYNHPAACGYEVGVSYDYDIIVKEIGLEKTKMLFIPVNFKWDEINVQVKDKNSK